MSPVIDGTFLTDYPWEIRARGEHARVPEMLGVNEDEGSMWLIPCEFNVSRIFGNVSLSSKLFVVHFNVKISKAVRGII